MQGAHLWARPTSIIALCPCSLAAADYAIMIGMTKTQSCRQLEKAQTGYHSHDVLINDLLSTVQLPLIIGTYQCLFSSPLAPCPRTGPICGDISRSRRINIARHRHRAQFPFLSLPSVRRRNRSVSVKWPAQSVLSIP